MTLDKDMNIILLIKDKNTQTIKVISTLGNDSQAETYSLKGLTLNKE